MLLVHYNNCLSKQTWGFFVHAMERFHHSMLQILHSSHVQQQVYCIKITRISPTPSPKILLVVNQKKTENIIQLNVAVLIIIMPTEKRLSTGSEKYYLTCHLECYYQN